MHATNATLCGGVKPVCVADLGVCGCAGPSDDRSCGAADSGLICSGAGGFCVPGCGPAPRNGCPTGQSCLDIMNGVGQCSGAMCHTRRGLPRAARALRSPAAAPDGHCVQCLFDTDCDAPLVCDPTKRKCEECVPGATTNTQCRPELAGSQCLTDGSCGCLADADCGGATSGRVCDATTSRCVPGCRGTGGNGCPSEQVCSSTTDTIGRCDAAPPTDGGADGGTDGSTDGGGADADGGGADAGGMDAGAKDAVADASAQTSHSPTTRARVPTRRHPTRATRSTAAATPGRRRSARSLHRRRRLPLRDRGDGGGVRLDCGAVGAGHHAAAAAPSLNGGTPSP